MALNRPRWTRTSAAAVAAFGLLAGCGGDGSADSALDRYLCESGDLPGDFFEQTRGDFSPENLADLAADADARKQEFREAGMLAGRFSYWKEAVDRPPFDPPVEVVCQALSFESEKASAAFVAQLEPTAEDLMTVAMVWLPEEDRKADEVSAPPGTTAGVRVFEMSAGSGDAAVRVWVFVAANERTVQTLYMGGSGPIPPLEEAGAAFAAFQDEGGS